MMGIIEAIKAELGRVNHAKKWEKELLQKIAELSGRETAMKVRAELKPMKKGSTYHGYVLRLNMVYQLLVEGVLLEDAIERAKKY